MTDHALRFQELYHENLTAFKSMLHSGAFTSSGFNLLWILRNVISDAGLDNFFYKAMEDDLLAGNFDVIYLDDRVVGEDKKRIKAQKDMARIKTECIKRQKQGMPDFEILFGTCFG